MNSFWSREPTVPRLFSVGREVTFNHRGPRPITIGGAGYGLLHAPSDPASLLLPNILYVVPYFHEGQRMPGDAVLSRAQKYSSSTDRAFPAWFAVPNQGFREVALVREVMYFYEGLGWPEHPFPRPMPLLEHSSWPLAWALVLPRGALIDDRGIVSP